MVYINSIDKCFGYPTIQPFFLHSILRRANYYDLFPCPWTSVLSLISIDILYEEPLGNPSGVVKFTGRRLDDRSKEKNKRRDCIGNSCSNSGC